MAEYINNKVAFEAGEWEMFKLISSTYLGKEYYFEQPDGTVYSRLSGVYFSSKEKAVNEFLALIAEN